ncbi:hypothetical protein ACHAW6_003471, partial [Cyclotella cf. meneghiniana]
MAQQIQIGSAVRIAYTVRIQSTAHAPSNDHHQQQHRTIFRRAMVATLPDSDDGRNGDNTCTLLLQDLTPYPLIETFLVTPLPITTHDDIQECEIEVPLSKLMPLLSFENPGENQQAKATDHDAVQTYKDYGDDLLRLHDYTSAISYYEAALQHTSPQFHVGGTLVLRRKGHCVIAELDCIHTDEDPLRYEVTRVLPDGTSEEYVVSSDDVLIAVWDRDEATRRGQREKSKKFLQPRILLNLSRCLLRLAEIDGEALSLSSSSCSNDRRISYRKAAVIGTSIAITLCEYHTNNADSDSPAQLLLTSLLEKARILRSRAFLQLGKIPHALADVK